MNTNNISISTELMKNYKQAELMSPEKKFEALQTDTGCSLLFSIGTDNVFYVTEERVGHNTGWSKTDLSTAQIKESFAGQNGLNCKTFEVAQSIVDGTIGMAMVISDGKSDHLFLSLGNSNSDTSWIKTPEWTQYPFDDPPKNITIANVFISETANDKQYIVVDILRDPTSAEKLISRYYINTKADGKPAWQPHDVSIDLEADSYSSCLGRQHLNSPHQPTIDGLYTSGQVNGNAQFTFQPLYNVFNPAIPAAPVRLKLPGGLIADSIASCRKSDMSTDLYVCSQGGLYYFASSNQSDGATAVLIVENSIYNGVKKMYAYQTEEVVIVWGLNGDDEIFYTSCQVGQETASPSVWSYPLPLETGVDEFSPYINRVNGGNTFFAVSDNTLKKLIKSPKTSLWQTQSITLPTLDTDNTQEYSSYTTRINVTDENNQPLTKTPITISADTRTGVYINHLYYVLDSTGVQIDTDELGSITSVEWVTGLTGTKLTISDDQNNATKVNPMDKPFSKIAQLNTVNSLRNATVTNSDGSNEPLISSNLSQENLETVANSNKVLGQAYSKLSTSNSPTMANAIALPSIDLSVEGFLDGIRADIGDLFHWLKSGVEAVIHIVEDVAKGVWHFVAKIAGKIYTGVLDAVEKVVGAVEWVFNAIKTAIKKLIKFLEFLFGWQDILTTHKVMKNVFTQLVQNSINNLSGYKTEIVSIFQTMQNDVDKWANIPNFDQTPNQTTADNKPLKGQHGSPAHLGFHHYQGNAANATSTFIPVSVSEDIFSDLLNLLESEEETIKCAAEAIKTDIIDQFHTLSVTQIIEKFIAIVADTLLQTAENVLVAVVDVFIQIAEGIMDVLDAPIKIPVISWLYKKLTGEDLSILDLICLISAIPATIIYKIATNETPFPKGDTFTESLINAKSFQDVQSLFFTSPTSEGLMLSDKSDPVLDESRLKVFGFMTGIDALAGSILLIITTALERADDDNPAPKTLALATALANVLYVSPNIASMVNTRSETAKKDWYIQLNNTLTEISILKGFVNILLTKIPGQNKWSKASPAVESIINTVWNVPVIINLGKNAGYSKTTYKSIIPETLGNFAFNVGGMMDFFIAIDPDPIDKTIESVFQFGLMGIYGICMPIAGGIYAFEKHPVQDHSG